MPKMHTCKDSKLMNLSREEQRELAVKFAPVVYLYSDDDRPSSVDWYLKRVTLCFKKDNNIILGAGEITPENLVAQEMDGYSSGADSFDGFNFYLRIPDENGHDLRKGEPISQGLCKTTCYAHLKYGNNSDDIYIQYWFFYPYNGDISNIGHPGTHDGDWEHVVVKINSEANKILGVYYARHSGEGECCSDGKCLVRVIWSQADKYDTGDHPSITMTNDGTIIEVHNGGGNNNLYYSIGCLDGNDIEWVKKGKKYDTGDSPSVVVTDDGSIIEVHDGGGNNNLYYSIGRLDGNDIDWAKKGEKYDTGKRPSVAVINSGTIIEVHNGGGNDNLYYSIGRLNGSDIDWAKKGEKYDTGDSPSVAMTDKGTVIEVHDGGGNNNLYYSIGRLDGNNIDWVKKGKKYDTGKRPVVAVTNDGAIIEMHNGGGNDNLYCNIGRLNGRDIDWERKGIKYDTGDSPSIAVTNNDRVIEVHNGGGNNNLYWHIGLLIDEDVPVVYSARHSHASYWTMGTHYREKTGYIFANDHTDKGPYWDIRDNLVVLLSDPKEDAENPWNQFSGHWGASRGEGTLESASPTGPSFKGSWCSDVCDGE